MTPRFAPAPATDPARPMLVTFAAALAAVGMLTYAAVLEKRVVRTHHVSHFSVARAFYILAAVLALVLAARPRALAAPELLAALADPAILQAGALTALAMLIYFWVLSRTALSRAAMVWPAVMLGTVLAAAVLLREPVAPAQWVGVALCVAGMALVSAGR